MDCVISELTPLEGSRDVAALREYLINVNMKVEVSTMPSYDGCGHNLILSSAKTNYNDSMESSRVRSLFSVSPLFLKI